MAALLIAAALAGCGAANKTGSVPGSGDGGSAGAATTTTAGTAVATATPNGVTLVVAQTPTNRIDPLRVIVINGFATPIQVADHQSGCGIVSVERQSGDAWTPVVPCRLETPTVLVTITAGSSYDQTVQPEGSWAPGTYRVVLRYVSGQDGGGPSGVLYSQPFAIG